MKMITYLQLVLSAFFWGGSAIAGKLAMEHFSVSMVTFLRFAIAALVLGIIYFRQIKDHHMSLSQHLKTAFTALFGITLCYYFYFRGLHLSSAFNAGIIEATIPCLTLFIAFTFGKTQKKLHQILGFVVAYIGVLFVIFKGDLGHVFALKYSIGDLLLLVSTFCFAIYNVLVEKNKKDTPNSVFMFYIFYYGSLILLLWPLYESIFSPMIMIRSDFYTWSAVLPILFMSVGGSVIAYLFFNQAISKIGAANASSFINFVPIITVILSVGYLGEAIQRSQWIGAIIIFCGVALSNFEPKNKRAKTQAGTNVQDA